MAQYPKGYGAGHGQAGKLRTSSEPGRVDPGFQSLRSCSNSQGVYFSANRNMVFSKYHIHLRMAETVCGWWVGVKTSILNSFLIKAKMLFQNIPVFSKGNDNLRENCSGEKPRHGDMPLCFRIVFQKKSHQPLPQPMIWNTSCKSSSKDSETHCS